LIVSDPIVVSVIGAAATIGGAVLGFPPLIQAVQQRWFPTPTIVASEISTSTLPPPFFTETPSATFSPAATFTPSATATITLAPTQTPIPPKMVIRHSANRLAGPVPVNIQFSVNGSYVEFSDGTRSYCSSTTCIYDWSVFWGDEVIESRRWQDTFGFLFKKIGLYRVCVKVCQGSICGEYEFQIEGRR
jgi:hypothetical protein